MGQNKQLCPAAGSLEERFVLFDNKSVLFDSWLREIYRSFAAINMAYREQFLVIKKSRLPGAGQGLFTRHAIAKGERIVEYKGRKITWAEAKQQKALNGYLFYISRNNVLDAKTYLKSFARYANDARGFTKIKGLNNNCLYFVEHNRVFVVAKRAIAKGEELLVAYGKEYWDNLKNDLQTN